MTTPNTPGNLNFQVVGTSSGRYQQDAAGNTVPGHLVYFRLSTGKSSSIFVPDTQWGDVEATAELVRQAAQHLAAVNAISGTLS